MFRRDAAVRIEQWLAWLPALIWMLVLTPVRAEAQASGTRPAENDGSLFAATAQTLTVDQIVIVVDRTGIETRGVLRGATPTSLQLTVDGHEREFSDPNIRAIFVESRHTSRGAWIGLGGGTAVGVVLSAIIGGSASGYLAGGALFGGIGAGVGALAGTAVLRRVRVYDGTAPFSDEGVLPSPHTEANVLVQETPAPVNLARPRPDRRWTMSFGAGTTSSGPAGDFEQAMRDAEFDENRGWCFFSSCIPGISHPFSRTGLGNAESLPWELNVQRRLSSWYGVAFSAGHSSIGFTSGQKRNAMLDLLHVSYAVTKLAPLFIVGPGQGFHAAIGPAWYSVTNRGGRPSGGGTSDTDHALGLVTQFGLAVPPRSRVFAQVLGEYRYVGQVEAGPFSIEGMASDSIATLPATTVHMNHWFVGAGVGLRF